MICHSPQRDTGPARGDRRTARFDWAGGTAHCPGAALQQAGPLMSAYGQAIADLSPGLPVLVNLPDPLHALAAFFGILARGRPCGIGNDRIASSVPAGVFHVVDAQLPPQEADDMPVSTTPAPFITFTGGTTGAPKAILRKQSSWLFSFARQGIAPQDRVAVLGDLSHSLALYAAVEALHRQADIWLLSGLRPKAQAAAIHREGITVIYATPTQLKLLSGSAPCPSVTRLFVGGGDFGADARALVRELFPNAVTGVFYGTSETSFVTISDASTPAGSVGRAYPGVTLKTDAEGLIWASSPMNFTDYLVSGASQARRQGAFVCVGDLGRIDADGFVYLTGRADRVVSISDRSVSLDEVERRIAVIEGVEQVAAVALPDARRGHTLGIALRGDPEVVRRQAAQLPKIRQIITVETWPILTSGKTDYRAIEALFTETKP